MAAKREDEEQMITLRVNLSTALASAGRAMAEVMGKKQDFDVALLFWGMEGRNLLHCGCGRRYQKLGWALRHLFKMGHEPEGARIPVGVNSK